MDARQKELARQYKERKIIGGIYLIRNSGDGKSVLASTKDMAGSENRFNFSKKTGMCADKRIEPDWNRLGADAFSFEILEEIERAETQSEREFENDLKEYYELWAGKCAEQGVAIV